MHKNVNALCSLGSLTLEKIIFHRAWFIIMMAAHIKVHDVDKVKEGMDKEGMVLTDGWMDGGWRVEGWRRALYLFTALFVYIAAAGIPGVSLGHSR